MREPLRICWLGIYDKKYPRNDILLRGLQANGVEIVECHAEWNDKDRFKILYRKLKEVSKDCDIIYAAYPSNTAVIMAKLLTRKPVVMDALYSMYDAVVNDRQEVAPFHPRGIKLWLDDYIAALLSDYMITDTKEHIKYWSRLPFVSKDKMRAVYTGVQDHIFFPTLDRVKNDKKDFIVSFHGFFIPLQGVDKIVEAARILAPHDDIKFRLIGSGQLSKKVTFLIEKYGLKNVDQMGRKTQEEIKDYSNEADVILGIFGDTEKTRRVVPNKVYEGMALKKPVITMDTTAVREIFSDKELLLVNNTPEAIARGILKLKEDFSLRQSLSENGYKKVIEEYSPKPLGKILLDMFFDFLNK